MLARLRINGRTHEHEVEPRLLLVHFIRERAGLTGTHVGCDTGNCGACTVLLDGRAIKSCMLLAIQAEESEVTTIEGLTADDNALHPIQQAFVDGFAAQCGYCTPGMILSATALLSANPSPTEQEIRQGLEGNLCMCTGYQQIVDAVALAADRLRSDHDS
jgi:aerobic carbon-monoxide dehydrogenase small subunit